MGTSGVEIAGSEWGVENCLIQRRSRLAFWSSFRLQILLVEREIIWRENRRLARLLRQAKLKQTQACMEDIDYRGSRNLDKRLMVTLAGGGWIRRSQNVLLTGTTGCGKTWLVSAPGNQACRQGFSVMYVLVPRLLDQLRIAHDDGSFGKLLARLVLETALLLDDWGSPRCNHPNGMIC